MLRKIIVSVIFFLGVFFFGFLTRDIIVKKFDSKLIFTRSLQKNSKLTNPLLDCDLNGHMSIVPVNSIQKQLISKINEFQNVSEVSIYFRDLNNGGSFGINEYAKFSPASLLKLPIMIAYLKLAEKNPELLEKKLIYPGNQVTFNNMREEDALIVGKEYTVDNLIYRMMSLSDNDAFELLYKNINPIQIKEIYKELDIIYPDDADIEEYITAKSYAGLFRILYNSTYLSREMSEKALEYLTKSDFHSGIQEGIPKGTVTALKFGVREMNDQKNVQLHDCGIVYKPEKPYLLCIMTRGKNYQDLIGVIQQISQNVYENVQKD